MARALRCLRVQEKGRNGGKAVREDDGGGCSLSSRAGKGRNGGKAVREDDAGGCSLSSRADAGWILRYAQNDREGAQNDSNSE